ncbi:histidine kinase [Rhodovulum sulfidophilum]|uniref:methyl-accepting chemotaxis protein n=1 Tax=Rhodovulum visakhapatnamense TaxID=364297 RepID=UPI000952FD26|nr:methyl-accepting chemotaxis protein [Rhodovulum visakhapatnamense]OLS44190.1 histidine kinase [Rhodovulum sulfidophilum]
MAEPASHAIGRFDKSFLIHMIKDFFLVLLAVTVLEFALKAALVYYKFETRGQDQARAVAEDLAENIRAIMRNEGGPVAARTMYPILERNWDDLGYKIAISPSPVTVRSIEALFGFTPEGIPLGDWPDSRFREAEVEIAAETFCLTCHAEAEVGQVLGRVTVRDYLERDFAVWLDDVTLSAGLAVGKIVLHSILLFLILRARMEPLLRLRGTVAGLARAFGTLSERAEVRTADEFGALAHDLNLFLDRISRLIDELNAVLRRVVRVNDDIVSVQGALRGQVDRLVGGVRRLERDAMLSAKREPLLSQAWFDAIKGAVADLDAALARAGEAPQAAGLVSDLSAVIANAEAQIAASQRLFEGLAGLGDETEALKGAIADMVRMEERMKLIIETGGTLVQRLRPDLAEAAPATLPERRTPPVRST